VGDLTCVIGLPMRRVAMIYRDLTGGADLFGGRGLPAIAVEAYPDLLLLRVRDIEVGFRGRCLPRIVRSGPSRGSSGRR